MIYRSAARAVQQLGERQFEGVAATSALQMDGWALEMAGADTSRLQSILFNHDVSAIVGRVASITKNATQLKFTGQFPSVGASRRADEACALLKEGILTGVSIGFDVQKSEPIAGGGRRATEWMALEISLVAVPLDAETVVTARAQKSREAPLDSGLALRLLRVAADFGRSITDRQMREVIAEADRLRREPAHHLAWVFAAEGGIRR